MFQLLSCSAAWNSAAKKAHGHENKGDEHGEENDAKVGLTKLGLPRNFHWRASSGILMYSHEFSWILVYSYVF